MLERMQAWFTGVGTSDQEQPASILADWNKYASAQTSTSSGLDLEAALPESIAPLLKSANETILGAFNSVSKGVRELPGNVQSAASTMPSSKQIMYCGILMGVGVFFLFVSFTFLPVMLVMPQKFAVCFTMGSLFVMGSFFALRGPKAQFFHLISKERLPFSVVFLGSMGITIYVSMVLHSYLLSLIFSVVQIFSLTYYIVSYFPGGATGMKFITTMATSSVKKCFGQ